MSKEVSVVQKVECPNPQVEAERGTTKLRRDMKMGVTVRKGEAPVIFEYVREDK